MTEISTSVPRRRLATIATIVALMTAIAPLSPIAAAGHHDAGAENRCYGVQGAGTTTFDAEVGGFIGVASFRLGGREQQVSSTARITGEASTSHVFEFAQGTLVTEDQLILKPLDPASGLFELRTRLNVVEGGTGGLHILPGSTVNLATGTASWQMRGHLCFD